MFAKKKMLTYHKDVIDAGQNDRLFAPGTDMDRALLRLSHMQKGTYYVQICDNYRLMHALFHIRIIIISRDRYWPEGFSPRVNIGRGVITVLKWKKACINLFITYFNIELKRTKLTSHTDTELMDRSDQYRLKDDNSPDMEKVMH
jgi:hypothetical protein